jgi:hypothetical protein
MSAAQRGQRREFDFLELPYDYAVIATQTCDIAEEGVPAQPCFGACPVYSYGNGVLPAYLVRLDPPDLPEGQWVADLRIEVPIEKSFLVGKRSIAGYPDEVGYLDFARQLGRRKERPAISSDLVDAVAKTLKRRKSNSNSFRRVMRNDVHRVRLRIDEGTRLQPVMARVHFYGKRPLSEEARDKLDAWFEEASADAEARGIHLLTNAYHDTTQMDLDLYESTIPLNV